MVLYVLAMLEQDGKLLLLLRKNSRFFSGYYGLVGGKIEEKESIADALIREMYEEVGITVSKQNLNFAHCLSFVGDEGTEVVALVFKVAEWQGCAINCEPDKVAALTWFEMNQLPQNIIPRHRHIIEMVQGGILYSEKGW